MTEREEMELAAKAAGLRHDGWHRDGGLAVWSGDAWVSWDPRNDDGAALRLSVKLGLCVSHWPRHETPEVWAGYRASDRHSGNIIEPYGSDPAAATREAIFQAAVEIGKAMP